MKKTSLLILTLFSLTYSFACDFTFNVKGPKVTFYSVSGTDTSNYTFFWNFGDGFFSSSAAATHTYNAVDTYTVSLTRISKITFDTCKLSKQVQVITTTCLTSFAHNLNGTIANVILTDTDILGASFEWNFGDGTIKSHPAGSHQYNTPGTFNITLTKQKNGETCTETKTVTVAPTAFKYEVSGTATATGSSLDKGTVILYKKINQNFFHYRNTSIGTSGSYSFADIQGGGDYVLKAVPSSTSDYFLTHQPTFSGDVTDWSSAEIISLNASVQKNISLIPSSSPAEADETWNTGEDKITGTITSNTSTTASKTVQAAKTSAEVAVEGALITLYNENGVKLSITYTDADGGYVFTQLIAGKYKLSVSYPGLAQEIELTATVDGDPATEENLAKINIDESAVTSIKNAYSLAILSYPNPVQQYLHILTTESHAEYKITISDLNSKVISSKILNAVNSIDVSALPSGFYILKIEISDKSGIVKFVKE